MRIFIVAALAGMLTLVGSAQALDAVCKPATEGFKRLPASDELRLQAQQVADMVNDTNVRVQLREAILDEGRIIGDRIVFVQDDIQYEIILDREWLADSVEPMRIGIFMGRPGAASSLVMNELNEDALDYVGDTGVDGSVDGGFDHYTYDGDYNARNSLGQATNPENRPYWEARYRAALDIALFYKRHHLRS